MKRLLAALSLSLVSLIACSSSSSNNQGSSEDENGTRGPAAIQSGWFKSPESISETITRTWQINLTEDEESRYIGGLRASLGGVSVAQQGSLLDRPNELYVLSTHSLSDLLAEKLVAKQLEMSSRGEPYVFDGLGFAGDDDGGCYADDSKDWCDSKDAITIGSLSSAATPIDPNAALSKEMRKRLMHVMQSIGEFFLMAIDERTILPGSTQHGPAFLVDEVFMSKLREGSGPITIEQERAAWHEVITTVLMSGYYFDLPADE